MQQETLSVLPTLERPAPEASVAPGSAAPAPTVRLARTYGLGSMLSAAIVVLFAIGVMWSALFNEAFGWPTFVEYFFSKPILTGVAMTLVLTAVSMFLAVVLGTILAIMRMSSNPILRGGAAAYCWFFRGIPVLVQLIFWYNFALLFPKIFLIPTNTLITPFIAAILGLGLSMAAYMAEVVRGGILSVGAGQVEAIRSLGMTRAEGLRRVVLPQAMRVVLPPMGNELIGLLKWTSLASVIAVSELMHQATLIYSRNFQTIPLLLVAAAWYLLVTTVFSIGQRYLERHFGKGAQH
jgi:polar amino acid transport system permease protein